MNAREIGKDQAKCASVALTWRELPQGGRVPDYANFCDRYWQGCSSCEEFMPNRVRFCRKWNRAEFGVDVIACQTLPDGGAELVAEADDAEPARDEIPLPEMSHARAWWAKQEAKA